MEGFLISCLLRSRGVGIPQNHKKGGFLMTGKTETRMREIRSRTRQYRKWYETRRLFSLTLCSLFLFAAIGVLFRSVQTPGAAAVAGGYGAVLLRDGAGAYVVVGIAAFAAGVALTVICIRLKKKKS